MSERYVCVHGHFYQPPRENAWLEAIELQDSAYPYHDWNERITAECYAPNMASRILDEQDRIVQIVNNYARISFDFGPTLLSWLETKAPRVYQALLEADRQSLELHAGHGSAMAQAYNHMILPLANRRDKRCQIVWGIRDFEIRFGRKPEGMWLPEAAVDLASLDLLAEAGIRFTVLAPHQARRVRAQGARRWREVSGGRVDPGMAYEQRLPSGRSIALFFYDGPVSRAVAFERLLDSGERFAERLLAGLSQEGPATARLEHIATDGETYGHHHRYGEMALTYALHRIESRQLATLTHYAAFLARHPPLNLVEIEENSSWSCAHGVERWRADCGCNTGAHPGWRQAWRAPLRATFDWLRDNLAPFYEERAGQLLRDPWAARDAYIELILDRSDESRRRFLEAHAGRELAQPERSTVWKLLEMQRHALLMYTSCGWFFDDLSGIETVQVMQYAARALQLAHELSGADLEPAFLERLAQAPSNRPEHGNGRAIYEKSVEPAMVDLHKVGAHYAVSLLFDSYEREARIYAFIVEQDEQQIMEEGRLRLALGRVRVRSIVTEEQAALIFGVLHFGDHNLTGGVREFQDEAQYRAMCAEVGQAFSRADLPEVVRQLDRHFVKLTYSLKSLFRDEQRRILNLLLESTLKEVDAAFLQLHGHHAPLMRYLTDLGIPLPGVLRVTGEYAVNALLREAIHDPALDLERIRRLAEDARQENIPLDRAGLALELQHALEREMEQLQAAPGNIEQLERMHAAVKLARGLPFEVALWEVQNRFYAMLIAHYPVFRRRAAQGDAEAARWLKHFTSLGETLRIRVE